jgi:hypothetical protein
MFLHLKQQHLLKGVYRWLMLVARLVHFVEYQLIQRDIYVPALMDIADE